LLYENVDVAIKFSNDNLRCNGAYGYKYSTSGSWTTRSGMVVN